MLTIHELTAQLDSLQVRLPQLIEEHPNDADFWPAFAGEADAIEDQAGDHRPIVGERIAAMLAEHGRYLAFADLGHNEG